MAANLTDSDTMSLQSKPVVLHVLTGSQSGAEVALQEAPYTVGTAEDCDVVLSGADVAENHFTLTVGASGVLIEAQAARIWMADGILEPGDRSEIDDAQALTLGGATSIAIGPKGTDWGSLPVPEAHEPEVSPSSDLDEEAEGDEPDAPDENAEASTAEAIGAEGPSEDGLVPGERPAPATTGPGRQRLGLIAACVVLLLVITGTAALLTFQTGGATNAQADPTQSIDDMIAAAKARVKALSLEEVHVEAEEGLNKIALTGYVADGGQLSALQASMAEGGIEFVDRVRAVSEMVDSVRMTLSGFGWPVSGYAEHLKVGYVGAGTLYVDGYIGSNVDRTRLHRAITTDVPAVAEVDFRRASLAAWADILRNGIADAGLSRWITVAPSGNRLRVSGELTHSEAETWRVAAEAFTKKSGGYPELEIDVRLNRPAQFQPAASVPEPPKQTKAQPTQPKVVISGVVTGTNGIKLALFSGGDILQVGESIGGFEVIDIQTNKVVLRSGKTVYTYDLGRKRYE